MEDVAKHPRLQQRGNVYYFRAKIPSDLVLHLSPAKERTFSLRTSDRREAMEKVRVESVKFDQEMVQARCQRDAHPKTSLSQIEIDRICAIFHHRLLHEDDSLRFDGSDDEDLYCAIKQQVEAAGGEAMFTDDEARRIKGMSDREFNKAGESIEILREGMRQALARGNTRPVQEDVDLLLEELGLKIDSSSQDYGKLSLGLLKTYVGAIDQLV